LCVDLTHIQSAAWPPSQSSQPGLQRHVFASPSSSGAGTGRCMRADPAYPTKENRAAETSRCVLISIRLDRPAWLPACLPACLPALLPACLPACLAAVVPISPRLRRNKQRRQPFGTRRRITSTQRIMKGEAGPGGRTYQEPRSGMKGPLIRRNRWH
jgi:hypothetical protein